MFSEEQINELSRNKNVSRCSSKSISYSKDFKLWAVKKYFKEGSSPNMIFREASFDLNILGKDRPKNCLRLWRKIYSDKGSAGLEKEQRGGKGGRKKKLQFRDKDEEIRYLRAKIAYMDAENDFLAKLRGLKRE